MAVKKIWDISTECVSSKYYFSSSDTLLQSPLDNGTFKNESVRFDKRWNDKYLDEAHWNRKDFS